MKSLFSLFAVNVFLIYFPINAFGTDEADKWGGLYRQSQGEHDLYIRRLGNMISVDIVNVNHPKESEGSHFIATLGRRSASFYDGHDCRVLLIRQQRGINLVDQCGSDGRDAGLYEKMNSIER